MSCEGPLPIVFCRKCQAEPEENVSAFPTYLKDVRPQRRDFKSTDYVVNNRQTRVRRAIVRSTVSYLNCGEKSVSSRYVESTFSTSFPFASDFSRTLFHSGSSWNDFQFAAAASRLGC